MEEAKAWPAKMVLGDVGYSCDPPDVLDSRINALPELRKIFSESKFDSQDAFEKMLEPLTSCFTYYKHWAFAEEREVRLTSALFPRTASATRILRSSSSVTTYTIFARPTSDGTT